MYQDAPFSGNVGVSTYRGSDRFLVLAEAVVVTGHGKSVSQKQSLPVSSSPSLPLPPSPLFLCVSIFLALSPLLSFSSLSLNHFSFLFFFFLANFFSHWGCGFVYKSLVSMLLLVVCPRLWISGVCVCVFVCPYRRS